MTRAAALFLLLLAACAGPRRELCGSLSDELRAVREKSRECDVPPSSLAADSCGDTSACTDDSNCLRCASFASIAARSTTRCCTTSACRARSRISCSLRCDTCLR